TVCSSSYTFLAGISPSMMRQKRQSVIVEGLGCQVSIQPHQVDRSCGRFSFTDQVLGALAVVVQDADSNPPVAYWTGKLGYFGTVVTAAKMISHVSGFFLV